MSTYTDLHNKTKETLNVDYNTRITPQKAHFLNPENSFHGAFVGEGHFTGQNHIDGGTIENVYLKDSIVEHLTFKNGLILDDIEQYLDMVSAELDKQALCDIYLHQTDIELSNNIITETRRRTIADELLSIQLTNLISQKDNESKSRDHVLSVAIDDEKAARIQADLQLAENLIDKHLKLVNPSRLEFPIHLTDFAVNTYIDRCPAAYVYKTIDTNSVPIGKIENALIENNVVTSFDFNTFIGDASTYEITGNGKYFYTFTLTENVQYTGVGGYRLTYEKNNNGSTNPLDGITLVLDSSNKSGYYNVYFENTVSVAGIVDETEIDSFGHLTKCNFYVLSKELEKFIRTYPYKFIHNNSYVDFNQDNKNYRINLDDNQFTLFENYREKPYVPVYNENKTSEYAKVYTEDITVANDTLYKLAVVLNSTKTKYELDTNNNFRALLTDPIYPDYSYIQYLNFENIVQLYTENISYKYIYPSNNGYAIPKKFYAKIDDNYAQIDVVLQNIECDPEILSYINRSHTLNKITNTERYEVIENVSSERFSNIKIVFNKFSYETNIICTYKDGQVAGVATLQPFVNISNPEQVIEQQVIFSSAKLCQNIKDIKESEKLIDIQYDSKHITNADVNSARKYKGEYKFWEYVAKIDKLNNVDFLIPEKSVIEGEDPNKYSEKFMLNVRISKSLQQEDDIVRINLVSRDKTKPDVFYYGGSTISKIDIYADTWHTLQFEEIRPRHYIVTDLDYSDIYYKLGNISSELSCHEVSSYAHIIKLSDDVEFLLSVDKEEMSYKGTLPYLSATERKDAELKSVYDIVHLSTFIKLSSHVYHDRLKLGDMFKLSAAQYYHDALYDKNGNYVWLGENDYFVINKYVKLSDVAAEDLDIFRNSESEAVFLSIELTKLINSTSSFISSEVVRISSELSTELNSLELSVNGLSNEVNRISAELSNTLYLSSDELLKLIISNDNDISVISVNVDFLLSVDKETVNYKGIIPEYIPLNPEHRRSWKLSEYINKALEQQRGRYPYLDIKHGDLFKVGIAPLSALYDKNDKTVIFGSGDFFIANKDIPNVQDVLVGDIDIFRDSLTEVGALSNALTSLINIVSTLLSNEIIAAELSVNGLSIEVDRISTELSNELNNTLLSVNGLSIEVNRVSSELSTELNNTQLSINGLSIEVDRISTELSNELNNTLLSVNGLSIEVDRISAELSNTLELSVNELLNQIISNDNDIFNISVYLSNDVMHYRETVTLSTIYLDPEGKAILIDTKTLFGLLITNPLIKNNPILTQRNYKISKGSVYRTISEDKNKYFEVKSIDGKLTLHNNCYIIAKNDISRVEDVKASDFEVIYDTYISESYLSSQLIRISSELSNELKAAELSVNGLSNIIDNLCSEINVVSTALELSVNGLSNIVDNLCSEINVVSIALELSVNYLSIEVDRISTELSNELNNTLLSVNGLSIEVDRISAELSNTLELSVNALQNQIISNDNDINTVSTNLSVLSHHYYDKTMSCNIMLEHVNTPDIGPQSHISAFIDKLLIVDEVTFDLYALTIRNGALNINKVKKIDTNYHLDCK